MRKYLVGVGLVLMAVHNPNQPLLSYAFLPWIGLSFLTAAIVSVPFKKYRQAGLGSPWVWFPLMCLCLTIAMSGVMQYVRGEVEVSKALAPTASAVVWFGLYLVARIDGEGIGKPIAVAVIIESVSLAFTAFVSGGERGGGLLSPTNYDIAAGVLVMGTFLAPRNWQWWLSGFAVVGLFFSGAEEGLLAIGVAVIVLIVLRDWSFKTLVPIWALAISIIMATPFGITQNLYLKQGSLAYGDNPSTLQKVEALQSGNFEIATGYRWGTHWLVRPVQPFGWGYNLTNFYWGIPHNILLVILDQVGPIGVLEWLVATFYCIKSRRYYLWATFLALSLFDHYFWTQIAPGW